MKNKPSFAGKEFEACLKDPEYIRLVAHALASELRLKILELIGAGGMNINEIARALDVPISTVALNMQVLESACLAFTEMQPGNRGMMKICNQRICKVTFDLYPKPAHMARQEEIEIPVGCYSLVGGIMPSCGYALESNCSYMDDPMAFYHPDHFKAQILWMREGYVEYHIPRTQVPPEQLEYLEISFEACSEAVGHKNDWPSVIYVEVNGRRIGVWRSPGDFGGRRGAYSPDWWSIHSSQYGHLKTFRVNRQGSWLENDYVSGTTLDQLAIEQDGMLRLRIGVCKDAEYAGGMNLFGKAFGDFPQGIIVRYGVVS